jgi:hypothetical protein
MGVKRREVAAVADAKSERNCAGGSPQDDVSDEGEFHVHVSPTIVPPNPPRRGCGGEINGGRSFEPVSCPNWETAALRKTTLLPGDRVAGLVYVARDVAANEVSLQIRIGDEILNFPFKQIFPDARRHRTAKEMFPNSTWRGQ